MIHIILVILKIIGILFLCLLGLLLLALLLVLLVPVRYQAQGTYDEKFCGMARITWLLHILSIKASFEEEAGVTVRLFGLRLFKEKKSAAAAGKEAKEGVVQAAGEVADAAERGVGAEVADAVRGAGQAVQDRAASAARGTEAEIRDRDEGEVPWSEDTVKPQDGGKGSDSRAPAPQSLPAALASAGRAASMEKVSEEDRRTAPKSADSTAPESGPGSKEEKPEAAEAGGIPSEKKGLFQKLKFSFQKICATLKNINSVKEQSLSWIRDEGNQKMLRLVYRQGKRALRHILPKRIKGDITFGFDDPYTTGQVLTYLSFIYPWVCGGLTVNPVFERQVLEGEVSLKGRIRLGVLLACVIRVWMNKNFRIVLKRALG